MHKTPPSFRDPDNLERFLTSRKKIISAEKSGVCAKHQRKLSKTIKYARFLAILPYISYR